MAKSSPVTHSQAAREFAEWDRSSFASAVGRSVNKDSDATNLLHHHSNLFVPLSPQDVHTYNLLVPKQARCTFAPLTGSLSNFASFRNGGTKGRRKEILIRFR